MMILPRRYDISVSDFTSSHSLSHKQRGNVSRSQNSTQEGVLVPLCESSVTTKEQIQIKEKENAESFPFSSNAGQTHLKKRTNICVQIGMKF